MDSHHSVPNIVSPQGLTSPRLNRFIKYDCIYTRGKSSPASNIQFQASCEAAAQALKQRCIVGNAAIRIMRPRILILNSPIFSSTCKTEHSVRQEPAMTIHPMPPCRSDLATIAVRTGHLLVPILRVRFTIVRKKNST